MKEIIKRMRGLAINAKITYHPPFRQFNEIYKIENPIIFPNTEKVIEFGRYDLGVFFLPMLRIYDTGAMYIYNNGLKKSFFVDDVGSVFESDVILFRDLSIENSVYYCKGNEIKLTLQNKQEDLNYGIPDMKDTRMKKWDIDLMLDLLGKFNTLNLDKIHHYTSDFRYNFKYQMRIQYE